MITSEQIETQTREETYPNKPIDTEAKQILFRDITHPQLSIAKLQNALKY